MDSSNPICPLHVHPAPYSPQSCSHTSRHAGHSNSDDSHTMPGIAVIYSDNFLALLSARSSNIVPGCPDPDINSTRNTPHCSEFYVPAKSTTPGPLDSQRIMMVRWVGDCKNGWVDE